MENTTEPPKKQGAEKKIDFAPLRADAAELVRDVGAVLDEKAHDAVASVSQKTEDAAAYVGRKAEDAACYVGQKTDEAGSAVGGKLRSLGQNVRDHGPESGMAGEASAAVADGLESSGRYLQEEGLKDIFEDVTNLIRRHAVPALIVGVVAGFLVGKAVTPRS